MPNLTLSEELDSSFITFSTYPTKHWRENLMGVILRAARSWTRYDDDATSDAVTTIFEKLPTFELQNPSGFSRWVSSVCARTRKRVYLARVEREGRSTQLDEEQAPSRDDHFVDLSGLDEWERKVASLILQGRTLNECADALGITPASLRQKLHRNRCHKIHA